MLMNSTDGRHHFLWKQLTIARSERERRDRAFFHNTGSAKTQRDQRSKTFKEWILWTDEDKHEGVLMNSLKLVKEVDSLRWK